MLACPVDGYPNLLRIRSVQHILRKPIRRAWRIRIIHTAIVVDIRPQTARWVVGMEYRAPPVLCEFLASIGIIRLRADDDILRPPDMV